VRKEKIEGVLGVLKQNVYYKELRGFNFAHVAFAIVR